MTEIPVLWKNIVIAAIVDSFSRKIIAMKAFGKRPTSDDLSALVKASFESCGASPQFLVTNQGS